jgi:hypothetical protein
MHFPRTKHPENRRTAAVIALAGAMIAATSAPALAIHNPIVVDVRPTVPNGARGHATFFQVGPNVDVTVILGRDRKGTQSVGIHKGTCAKYDPRPDWVVVGVASTTQDTRLPNLSLPRLLNHALVVHRTKSRSSPAIGCADIRDRG